MFDDRDIAFQKTRVHENIFYLLKKELYSFSRLSKILYLALSFQAFLVFLNMSASTLRQAAVPFIRSKLFVPGSRPELFGKALQSDADAISIDLEDAVQETQKGQAREAVRAFLASPDFSGNGKTVIVRVNGLDTPHFENDVDACLYPGTGIINVPKLESAEDVRRAAAVLARVEKKRGIDSPVRILANIESPKGLRLAAEIAAADERIIGLQLGFADLLEPLGIDRANEKAIQTIQLMVRLSAGEAGVAAYDAAYGDIRNADGFRSEALAAMSLGFAGKTCIHPSQIAAANEVFQPSDKQIADALQVTAAWRQAQLHGVGAIAVNGKMIDAPFAMRAQAIVDMAQRLGRISAASGT
jgi:citrate lyase subunit beta/citryl-CoA lyase